MKIQNMEPLIGNVIFSRCILLIEEDIMNIFQQKSQSVEKSLRYDDLNLILFKN